VVDGRFLSHSELRHVVELILRRIMKTMLRVFACVLIVGNCVVGGQMKADAGSEQLIKLEAEFAKTTAEKGFDGFMSYFAEDGYDLPNGGELVQGKENIRKALGPWGPDFKLSWTPVKAEMAASGDLGYTFGNYVATSRDKEGKAVEHHGKYVTIWKKQADGSWKVLMDMGNSSPEKKE
jgi:ketosteroid isomerase-like protein